MRSVNEFKQLWPAGVALLLAIAIAAVANHETRIGRLVNADLRAKGIVETYIVPSSTEPDSCRLVGRRGATVHRNESGAGGPKWKCRRIQSAGAAAQTDLWLLRAKRLGTGTVFFVSVDDVPDLQFPYLYEFVRARLPADALPQIQWTQLYVSRIYQGLYLRVALPFDPRKRDGGGGVRTELLTLREDHLSIFDTRFSEAGDLYASTREAAALPELDRTEPLLIWLSELSPTHERPLQLTNVAPHRLSPLPLPVSLCRLFERVNGYAAAAKPDPDLASLFPLVARSGSPPISAAAFEELVSGYESYSGALLAALASHERVRGDEPSQQIATRLAKLPSDWLNATQ